VTVRDITTIAYYNRNAAAFVAKTVDAAMDDALRQFTELLPMRARVLDWGCGSGRDSLAMRKLGFDVTSVDASPEICAQALAATGTVVRVESFDELSETEAYDGIWACASLLHVKPEELPDVLGKAAHALRDGGVLYCSFKRGTSCGYRNGRWFTHMEEDVLLELINPHFDIVRVWVSADVRPGRSDEQWLNCLATKR
jgi:cyclopropane fatty-acyl-phospholipid synthase-like methyltransferase